MQANHKPRGWDVARAFRTILRSVLLWSIVARLEKKNKELSLIIYSGIGEESTWAYSSYADKGEYSVLRPPTAVFYR